MIIIGFICCLTSFCFVFFSLAGRTCILNSCGSISQPTIWFEYVFGTFKNMLDDDVGPLGNEIIHRALYLLHPIL